MLILKDINSLLKVSDRVVGPRQVKPQLVLVRLIEYQFLSEFNHLLVAALPVEEHKVALRFVEARRFKIADSSI